MAANSAIEWTEHTWNPTTGCTKVSPGCKNCYAELMARRLKAMGVKGYEKGFMLTLHPERLAIPLRRQTPTLYFVNSMSDLFHRHIRDEFIAQVFEVMRKAPHHTFQVLTKRAKRMADFLDSFEMPQNVWMGVTVEDRLHGLPRIDHLRRVRASVRFLSLEPLLEELGVINLTDVDWVVVGGESGPKGRIMKSEWVEHVRSDCEAQKTAFFFKQWGSWGPDGKKRNKKANGRVFLGRTWDDMPTLERPCYAA